MLSDLPTGTGIFLFTDVEGSTRLVAATGITAARHSWAAYGRTKTR